MIVLFKLIEKPFKEIILSNRKTKLFFVSSILLGYLLVSINIAGMLLQNFVVYFQLNDQKLTKHK